VRVKASGRVGVLIQHDPLDLNVCYKLSFSDGALPETDWFAQADVEDVDIDLEPLLPSTATECEPDVSRENGSLDVAPAPQMSTEQFFIGGDDETEDGGEPHREPPPETRKKAASAGQVSELLKLYEGKVLPVSATSTVGTSNSCRSAAAAASPGSPRTLGASPALSVLEGRVQHIEAQFGLLSEFAVKFSQLSAASTESSARPKPLSRGASFAPEFAGL